MSSTVIDIWSTSVPLFPVTLNMTCLSFEDIFANAMHFSTSDGLLYRTAMRFSEPFLRDSICYFIVGGYALIHHGIIRNTTDVDIIVNDSDFLRASQVRNFLGRSHGVIEEGTWRRSMLISALSLGNVLDFARNRVFNSHRWWIVRPISTWTILIDRSARCAGLLSKPQWNKSSSLWTRYFLLYSAE